MYEQNQTHVVEILLLGFQNLHNFKIVLFVLFLMIYIATLTGNIVIIMLVGLHRQLHTPMYFFLSLLSTSEIITTSNIVPKMLQGILEDGCKLSFKECMIQFYIFSSSTNAECFLLTAMSYDRYVAICNPLRYVSIMDLRLRLHLVFWSWAIGFMITAIIVTMVLKLDFCGPNIINHFFCDMAPILNLSCSDTTVVEIQAFLFSLPVILFPFIFITVTYVYISFAIHRLSSTTERQKAFSTCSSHLAVVCTYYGTLISVYVVPSKGHLPTVNKVLSLLYIIVTPLLNPIIYSLRNQEIKISLRKCISRQ
ncbi:olfactory receptor 11L1-like [Pelobates fuscus]|uniref:olfactory receptor 11L1-like n=1 Tax=Pelobates fuscus TaxID=191477 RepID=UPI002FE458E3